MLWNVYAITMVIAPYVFVTFNIHEFAEFQNCKMRYFEAQMTQKKFPHQGVNLSRTKHAFRTLQNSASNDKNVDVSITSCSISFLFLLYVHVINLFKLI